MGVSENTGVFFIFYVKTINYFRRQLTISEASVCRGSTKPTYSWKICDRERPVPVSLFKTSFTFKCRLWRKCFHLNSVLFKKHFFRKTPSGDCFCLFKNYSGSMQNLPLKCWYNNSKTPAKKFVNKVSDLFRKLTF